MYTREGSEPSSASTVVTAVPDALFSGTVAWYTVEENTGPSTDTTLGSTRSVGSKISISDTPCHGDCLARLEHINAHECC